MLTIGLAILVSIANSRTANVVSQGVRDQAGALSEGFQTAFLVGAGFALVGAVLAAVTISSRDCRKRIEAGRVEVPVPGAAQPQAQRAVAAG